MMIRRAFVAGIVSAAVLSGCASIVTGSSQQLKIDSNPQGAGIFVYKKKSENGADTLTERSQVGVTPGTVTVERAGIVIRVEKDGYEPAEVPVHRAMNDWVWGDIVLTSPLSTSIDASTGAYKEYDPGEYMVELKAAAK